MKRPDSNWMKASAVGIEMAAGVVVGLLGGQWADAQLGTDPWLTLFGLIVGAGVGFKAILRVAKSFDDDDQPRS